MIRRNSMFTLAIPVLLSACAAPPLETPAAAPVPPAAKSDVVMPSATRVLDRAAVERLLANKGVTLQWISWDQRGSAHARWDGDLLRLTGAQAKAGEGRLYLDGAVAEIGADYFTFRGTIRIEDAPDQGRLCELSKTWHFAITQNRPYWRLREFEWCDGLTDYIDIYF